MKKILFLLVALGLVLGMASQAVAGPLPGAIFTTLSDGSRVNANIYQAKEDVYLDGGPGPNAPSSAAGLPQGWYYFQVTDPSGKSLLSTDAVKYRKFHVNGYGVIDQVYNHLTGIDQDHSALTVQLMPYLNTPNKGGVYKVWVTPVDRFVGDPDKVDNPQYFHGFVPSWSKTDNFKVKKRRFVAPILNVYKFHDKDLDGYRDADEEWITGWVVYITDPNNVPYNGALYTPVEDVIAEPPGIWKVVEDTPDGTLQTVSIRDGEEMSSYPAADPAVEVNVAGTSGEQHTVVYGDVGLGQIQARKVYDRNGNGEPDSDEPGVQGWKMKLTGTTVNGATIDPIFKTTGADGFAVFPDLLPGDYTVTEVMPSGDCWEATSPTSFDVTIESVLSGANLVGTSATVTFTNLCKGHADFDTKGYWHNKNGLLETTAADVAYLNDLLPWLSPSSYFDAGDEPIDGYFQDGTPVVAAKGEWGEIIAPAGSALAEQSHFLVDPNAGGDPREQLAQQLDAFVMNALHRLDSIDATIQLPDGSWIVASDLINDAVIVWAIGAYSERVAMQELLNSLNENDNVPFIHYNPCPVVYP